MVDSRMSELIVGSPLLRVRQHLIGLFGLLELDLSLCPGIAVRVKFHGQSAVGLLQICLAGILADAEQFVIVTL